MVANNKISALSLLVAFALTASAQHSSAGGQGQVTVRHRRVADASGDSVPPSVVEAERALDKKDYARAEQLLTATASTSPDHYRTWFDLGMLYSVTDRKPKAIEAYRKSVELKPEVFESSLNLGLLLASAGEKTEAVKYLRAATALKPSQQETASDALFTAWDVLGEVQKSDAPAEAVTAFQKAAELHPKDFEPHLAAAQILERNNNFEGAEKEYKQALELKPESTLALGGLTDVYIVEKRFPEAEQSLRSYLKMNPQSAPAHVQLGRILASSGHADEALAEFETAQQIAPQDRQAQREIADLAFQAKKYGEAEELYRSLLKDDTRNAGLHEALANSLMNERKFPEAQQEFIACLKIDSSRASAYEELATVAAENKNYPLVLQALDARAKYLPETAGTYFLRASSYDHLHDEKQAAANYHLFLAAANGKYPNQEWQAKHRLIAIEPKK